MVLPRPKQTVQCPANCSLRPEAIGPGLTAVLLQMRENGAGEPSMTRRMSELIGRPFPKTNMTRHLKHYRDLNSEEIESAEDEDSEKVSDLAVIERIIAAGVRNQKTWRPTLRDTMDAVKLKMQLTGNSIYEDFLSGMDEAVLEDALNAEENPEATEDLPEPVF